MFSWSCSFSSCDIKRGHKFKLLKDSKKISFKKRIEIAEHIKLNSTYAIGLASVEEILKFKYLTSGLAFDEKSN
jgi:ribonuclease HII